MLTQSLWFAKYICVGEEILDSVYVMVLSFYNHELELSYNHNFDSLLVQFI